MRLGGRSRTGPVRLDARVPRRHHRADPTWGFTAGLTWVFKAFNVPVGGDSADSTLSDVGDLSRTARPAVQSKPARHDRRAARASARPAGMAGRSQRRAAQDGIAEAARPRMLDGVRDFAGQHRRAVGASRSTAFVARRVTQDVRGLRAVPARQVRERRRDRAIEPSSRSVSTRRPSTSAIAGMRQQRRRRAAPPDRSRPSSAQHGVDRALGRQPRRRVFHADQRNQTRRPADWHG